MGYTEFVPTYRVRRYWSDRIKLSNVPLFPGYVFCQFDVERRLPILKIPGTVGIVGSGKMPLPIPETEISAIRQVSDSQLRVLPWPFLQVGQSVEIRKGPLAGVAGVLIAVKNDLRVVVSLSLLQRSIAAEVEADWLQPVTSRTKRINELPRVLSAIA
jgi:transcription antitermination factor NusG